MRLLVVWTALALAAAGCGGTTDVVAPTRTGHPAEESLQPPPPIQAVDESADTFLWWDDDSGITKSDVKSQTVCLFASGDDEVAPAPPDPSGGDDCSKIPPQELAKLRAHEREYRESVTPAKGVEPRTIARLRLAGGSRVDLVAWRTQKDQLCLDATSWDGESGGGAGPFGPCLDDANCTAGLCFVELTDSSPDGRVVRYSLAAVVPAAADRIQITTGGGRTFAYPLTGPLVPGFTERVFMVDLGSKGYRRIEVSAAGSSVATVEKRPQEVAWEECAERMSAWPEDDASEAEAKAAMDRLDECVKQADESRTTSTAG
jgi:hypothetical protein